MFPNLKAEMARRGLTVKGLAVLAGIPYSTLSQKLKGARGLSYDEALKIKTALGVSIPLEILFSKEVA